jgi:hypothetical protein
MMKDFSESEALIADYRESEASISSEIDHNIYVLKQSAWPINCNENLSVKVPQFIQNMHHSFTEFYKKRHSGKVLLFAVHIATAILKANFSDKQ